MNQRGSESKSRSASKQDAIEAEMRVGWKMAGLGLETGAAAIAGAGLGWLWDQWRGTTPNGLMYGAIIGVVVGLVSLVRGALKLNRQLERAHPTRGRGRPLTPVETPEDDSWDRDFGKENDDAGGSERDKAGKPNNG